MDIRIYDSEKRAVSPHTHTHPAQDAVIVTPLVDQRNADGRPRRPDRVWFLSRRALCDAHWSSFIDKVD